MKYRKKPVVIEAVQYEGQGNFKDAEVPGWIWEAFENGSITPAPASGALFIRTMEGEHRASPGDYIIRGVQGELYPCKPDVFDATYEPVGRGDG